MTIVVHISGGIGNQMFQYAVGRALADRLKTKLELDTSSFSDDKAGRKYMLGNYNIRGSVQRLPHPLIKKVKAIIRASFSRVHSYKVYGEKTNTFDKNVLTLKDKTYLLGHWQSEKYFILYKNQIKEDLSYRGKLSEYAATVANKINKTADSIAVHIRRGDYVTNPTASRVLGILPLSYYEKSFEYMRSKLKYPHFFIFTDDPEWAKKNMENGVKNITYVVTDSACEDMELMKLCRHQIIANSSFSWWSAWLNPNLKKIVIAPKKWFNDKKYSAKDLVPKDWVQV